VQKFKQSILFKGLRIDGDEFKTGTDIDFEYEDGKIWIKAEVKEYGKDILTGQRILFERFAKNIKKYEVYCFLLWKKKPQNEDIYIKDCIVKKVYYNKKWHDKEQHQISFKKAFNKIIYKNY
jgi:hypothetical protein